VVLVVLVRVGVQTENQMKGYMKRRNTMLEKKASRALKGLEIGSIDVRLYERVGFEVVGEWEVLA
jgi:hypothetical protein